MKTIRAIDIDYETDGAKITLPKELDFEVEDDFDPEEELADLVSDKTGWLVKSVDYLNLCGNCGKVATIELGSIHRCERCAEL